MPDIRNIVVGFVRKDGHLLVQEGHDRVERRDFYRAIGGGIEFGETAEAAVRREFREELNVGLTTVTLLGVVENLFEYEGQPGHEVVHVFEVASDELSALPLTQERVVLDEGSPVRWVPLDALHGGDLALYPEAAAALILI